MDGSPELIPQPASSLELNPEDLPRDETGLVLWGEAFEATRPLRVEVGVGTSTFLIDVAEQHEGHSFVGLEYSAKRVAKFLKKVERRGVSNIRMLRADAVRWVPRLFGDGSVDHFYVNHPDPWPKRRHQKKRFVNPDNAALLARLLRPGGGLSLRTDFAEYAQQMLEVLDAEDMLQNLSGRGNFAASPVEPTRTLYENKFLLAGVQIFYLEYARIGGHGTATSHSR